MRHENFPKIYFWKMFTIQITTQHTQHNITISLQKSIIQACKHICGVQKIFVKSNIIHKLRVCLYGSRENMPKMLLTLVQKHFLSISTATRLPIVHLDTVFSLCDIFVQAASLQIIIVLPVLVSSALQHGKSGAIHSIAAFNARLCLCIVLQTFYARIRWSPALEDS